MEQMDFLVSFVIDSYLPSLFLLNSNGDVRVNWATVTKNNTTIKTGDMISVSGKGRLKVSYEANKKLFSCTTL